MNSLSTEEGRILVGTARQAITHHLEGKTLDPTQLANSELSIPRGVFVTLFDHMIRRRMRGCIGNPFPKTSLLSETVRCAVEAATMDPRFAAVRRAGVGRRVGVGGTGLSPLRQYIVQRSPGPPLTNQTGPGVLVVGGGGSQR